MTLEALGRPHEAPRYGLPGQTQRCFVLVLRASVALPLSPT